MDSETGQIVKLCKNHAGVFIAVASHTSVGSFVKKFGDSDTRAPLDEAERNMGKSADQLNFVQQQVLFVTHLVRPMFGC